jgi:hypothetical protein
MAASMHRIRFSSSAAAAALALAAVASPALGQTGGFPTISARQYTGGSAKLTVKGAVQFEEEVAINTQASISDGEMTWLQFGASGAESPNALITYGNGEVGVSVGRGKFTVIAGNPPGETPQCAGKAEVTASSITAHYTCKGVTTYDSGSGKMGKVDIEVKFTAQS